MGDDLYHCYCTGVTQQRVLITMAGGEQTIDGIRRTTGACTGCQSCRRELESLLEAVAAGSVQLPAAPSR